jgi:hypothetical protein
MYICNRCGHIADTPAEFIQLHPYGDGYAGETLQNLDCPVCGYEMDEAEKCLVCGQIKSTEDVDFYNGICEHCLREKAEDFDTVRKCAEIYPEKRTVEVDTLIHYLLSPEDVNSALWSYLKACCDDKKYGWLNAQRYQKKAEVWAVSDMSWFGETLSEVMKNEQNGA